MKKRICVLFFSPGAGHRATANALYKELLTRSEIKVELVNFIEEYHVTGFENSPESYRFTLKYFPWLHGYIVKFANQKIGSKVIMNSYEKVARKYYDDFYAKHPADVYISTCYYDNALFNYLQRRYPHIKTIMMVSDIVHPLRIWFDQNRDLTILPSQEIYDKGYAYFAQFAHKVNIMGLPLVPIFYKKRYQSDLKHELKVADKQLILISGGGEGMNVVTQIVKELDKQLTNVNICVICGKNKTQQQQLLKMRYHNNVIALGWTDRFAQYLLASDLVITKAGATTIWEAMTAKKRTIIFDKIPGQEDGNPEFAANYNKAVFEKNPLKIAILAKTMLADDILIKHHPYMNNWTAKISSLLIKF